MFRSRTFRLAVLLSAAASASSAYAALDEVRFGVPPWPGVTVKTEVASELLETLGYKPEPRQLGVSIVVKSLVDGDLDAYLAGWYPTEEPMIEPLVKQGKLDKVVANVDDAIEGLAVPDYVWDAGVHKVSDLPKYRDKFDGKIYGIEAGGGISNHIDDAIAHNYDGLGKWEQVNSSTSAMLAQVGQKTRNHDWIVFVGWRPHWMNITYDMKYLQDKPGSQIGDAKSTVWTVTPASLKQNDPNLYRFFKQFVVGSKIQNNWIYQYSHEKRDPEDVAREWITAHPDTVKQWLAGVTTQDGQDAMTAVAKRFK